jgi:Amt family ammonium transporter
MTLIIGLALKATMGWRISDDDETVGIDQTEHAETAYELAARGGRLGGLAEAPAEALSYEGAK